MNAAQVHLALTHVPVILSVTGLAVLIVSLFNKNVTTQRIAFYILIVAGLFTIPVFLSGEGGEEIVEDFPGVSESIIEQHEEFANFTIYAILVAAVGSIIGLLRLAPAWKKAVYYFVLVSAILTSALMLQTAHLGGQIRHTEIRPDAIASQDAGENDGGENEEDDD